MKIMNNLRNKIKQLICCLMPLLLLSTAMAQQVSGVVFGLNEKNVKETLPGANVHWLGTSVATTTDINGRFQITSPDTLPATLIVSMVGYNADTSFVNQNNKADLTITLKNTIKLSTVTVEAKQASTTYSTFNPINTEIINSKELLKAACCNLSESFSTNASVDVTFSDAVSGAKKIQMLGLDGIYTQILSENMPMLRGLSSAYGLSYIPGTWIENIRVTKGTGSVVNGYESVSGQINLDFLKPKVQKERLFLNVYGNQKGRTEANVHWAPKLNQKWGTLLFLHGSGLQLKNDMNKDAFLDMPLTQQYNVFNRWDYHNQKNFEAQFGVKGLLETRRAGQLNFNPDAIRDTNNAYGIGVDTKVLEYFSKTGWVSPEKPYQSFGIQTSGKWQQQQMFFGLRNYKGEQKNIYVNAIYAGIIGNTNHKYKTGASYLLDDYSETFNDSAFARTESVPGVFAEYTYTHEDNFSLVAGAREDFHNMFGLQFTPRLHMRYNPTKTTTVRLSGGSGFRVANVFVENQSVFASSRKVMVTEKLNPEKAWNYGISANQKFKIFAKEAAINVDFFRTDFENQVIVDLDKNVNQVWFYNLNGTSYSNSFQTDFDYTPLEGFDIKLAYKWYDVKTTYHGKVLDRPYVPKNRVLLNLSYSTYMDIWRFNVNSNWLGTSRLPNTDASPIEYRLSERSKSYFLFNAQITKKFRKFESYLGCENILNYTQQNAIVAADKPFSNNFDASMIYAPMDGRIVYVGLRMGIK